jgi:hypothetical protein
MFVGCVGVAHIWVYVCPNVTVFATMSLGPQLYKPKGVIAQIPRRSVRVGDWTTLATTVPVCVSQSDWGGHLNLVRPSVHACMRPCVHACGCMAMLPQLVLLFAASFGSSSLLPTPAPCTVASGAAADVSAAHFDRLLFRFCWGGRVGGRTRR